MYKTQALVKDTGKATKTQTTHKPDQQHAIPRHQTKHKQNKNIGNKNTHTHTRARTHKSSPLILEEGSTDVAGAVGEGN